MSERCNVIGRVGDESVPLLDCECVIVEAEHNYISPEDRTSRVAREPSYSRDDMTTREVVQLSKLPDAHQPCDDEIPAIERADWPAPPHPAAAYPELRQYKLMHYL